MQLLLWWESAEEVSAAILWVHFCSHATDTTTERVPAATNQAYATIEEIPMDSNQAHGTTADIPVDFNQAYGTTADIPVDSNQAYGTTADIPVDLNECYGATVAPSQEDPDQLLYASVKEDNEQVTEDYDYV